MQDSVQDNVIIGVNILETLTTGMYRDAKVIFREYIQNSCDQIDEAVERGLLKPNDGNIEIWIKDDYVSIEDNATAIPAEKFKKTLYSIGESEKIAGKIEVFVVLGIGVALHIVKPLFSRLKHPAKILIQ